jgi:hypothetical protein
MRSPFLLHLHFSRVSGSGSSVMAKSAACGGTMLARDPPRFRPSAIAATYTDSQVWPAIVESVTQWNRPSTSDWGYLQTCHSEA